MVVAQVGQGVVGALESGGEDLGRGDGRLAERQLGERATPARLVGASGGSCADAAGSLTFFLWRNFLFWSCAWGRLLSIEYLRF